MKAAATQIKMGYRKAGGIVLAVTLAALIGGLSSLPVRADEYQDRGRDEQPGRDHKDQRPEYRSYGYYRAPNYVYAPPPVYYAPVPRQPVIDFVFPLSFR